MANSVALAAGSADSISSHLETHYGIKTSGVSQLDEGVIRIERDGSTDWVARVFDQTRGIELVEGDAEILRFLEEQDFPCERLAHSEPVSMTPEGQSVILTTFIEGRRPRKGDWVFPKLGGLLGRLHTLSYPTTGPISRSGGAWHHISSEGTPNDEIRATLSLLDDAMQRATADQLERYKELHNKLKEVDDFEGLPCTFTHPDLVPSNIVTLNDGEFVVVDWAGSGVGPRLPSLGFLLWVAGNFSMAQVEAVMHEYSRYVRLEENERSKLVSAILFRPLVLRCWEVCKGRKDIEDVSGSLSSLQGLVDKIASTAFRVSM